MKVDREKTCPLLLRVFPRLGGPHRPDDYDVRRGLPKDEVQIYTWPDATLAELAELLRAVPPANSKPRARLVFALAYPDRSGRPLMRQIGTVLPPGGQHVRAEELKTLRELRFETGAFFVLLNSARSARC